MVTDLKALVLTGPPAAGKSTVAQLLSDHGVPVKDTGELIRERTRQRLPDDEPVTEDECWYVAEDLREEHGDKAPTCLLGDYWLGKQRTLGHDVVCVSSLRNEAEIEWLREQVAHVLVARIEADDSVRTERYVEMNLDDGEDRSAVSRDRITELRKELFNRELREQPYPEHDVTIRSGAGTRVRDLSRRLQRLVEVIGA